MRWDQLLRSVITSAIVLVVVGWAVTASADTTTVDTVADPLEPLQPKLDARKSSFMERAPQETIDLYEGAIDQLRESGILDRALNVGDTVPEFALPSATGDTVALASLIDDGPVVVTWYRGGW
ncbi:MAG: hypothetical protein GF341_03230 [candidate division Zixibacteria bacterium]|nr:hypothetical protein [candidate division Zixibacteria bacterium]